MRKGLEKIRFEVFEKEFYTLVYFELSAPLEPGDLNSIHPPKINSRKGVVLSGRGPVWLYCYLTHYYHPTRFIAIYDPRIGGAVVIETHTNEHSIGNTINVAME